MNSLNSKLTFFVNQASGNFFLLDIQGKTLDAVSYKDVYVLDKYKHLMGFEGAYRTIKIPNYEIMKKFKKALKTLDLSQAGDDVASYLVNLYPEFFI